VHFDLLDEDLNLLGQLGLLLIGSLQLQVGGVHQVRQFGNLEKEISQFHNCAIVTYMVLRLVNFFANSNVGTIDRQPIWSREKYIIFIDI
jgi:hypothetical protein